jgi:hypothetical protein
VDRRSAVGSRSVSNSATSSPDAAPLLLAVAGPRPVDVDALGRPARIIGTIEAHAVTRRLDTWQADLLVWASDAPVPGAISRRFPQLVTPLERPVFHVGFDPSRATPLPWSFRCNLCGTTNQLNEPLPAGRSCVRCLSNVRYRATAHALTSHLFGGADIPLVDAPRRPHVRVVGIGDWPRLARTLADTFDYVNTRVDSEPRLDLTAPLAPSLTGRHDVVLAGDVLEHVAPPLPTAMGNLRRLLRPGGSAVITVPWTASGHVEHFPALHRYDVRYEDGRAVLWNERRDGAIERFDELCFHGPGRSLEMRVFSKASLLEALAAAGFESIRVCDEPAAQHGIAHRPGRPVPVIARAPGSSDR